MELTDFDIFAQAVTNLPPAGSAPSGLVSNPSLVATGTIGHSSLPPHHPQPYWVPPQQRFLHAPASAPAPSPCTPALKPAPALETSPVTPGVASSYTGTTPTPLHLPTAASDAEPSQVAPTPTPAPAPPAARAGDVQTLLKWVTREPVALPGSYRPGSAVQRAFESLRAGDNNVNAAMAELHRDVAWYVDKRKEAKRHTHKRRLRHVEAQLSMEQREVARHRIEASLTKFKKTENEKALRAAMRWLAEQIHVSAVK